MNKKVVLYKADSLFLRPLDGAIKAVCIPINHTSEYVSNTQYVVTSSILRFLDTSKENIEFETLNSIYQPDSRY